MLSEREERKTRLRYPSLQRSMIALLVALSLLLFPTFALGRETPDWVPPSLSNWAFDVRLAVGPPLKAFSSFVQGFPWDDRVYVDNFGVPVEFESRGVTLVGTVYRVEDIGQQPGILLLHGSTPEGRSLGIYRLLGRELAERGYVVLAIDQRGYGASDDPPRVDQSEAFDYVGDARNAVGFLSSLEGVDEKAIYVIGHSFGADVAITTGVEDSRIRKIVAIGPGRRLSERVGDEAAPEVDYFRRRDMRYMGLTEPIPAEVFIHYRASLLIDNHLDYFSEEGHKPLLLIDGELESEEDHRFLERIVISMVAPKAYVTLPNSDHYANIANIRQIVLYDRLAVEQVVREIDSWLSQVE